MRESDLPSPNIGSRGHHLRRVAAQAISQLQITAAAYGGKHPSATPLAAFFRSCTAAAKALMPVADNTYAEVSTGQVLTIPVTGTYTTKATLTVAGGAVTGIVLS